MNGISVLIALFPTCEVTEKTAVYEPRSQTSSDTEVADSGLLNLHKL